VSRATYEYPPDATESIPSELRIVLSGIDNSRHGKVATTLGLSNGSVIAALGCGASATKAIDEQALPCPADTTLELTFWTASAEPEILFATAEYEQLWLARGGEIVERLETQTGLHFAERDLRAEIYEGPSRSHPLRLRASYDRDTKLGTLVHELAHCLVADGYSVEARGLESHELIYLFLFDVWSDLFGASFAQRQVEIESQRRPLYADAWRSALAIDRAARAVRLAAALGGP